MNQYRIWVNWLIILGCILVLFGILMALFNNTAFFAIFNQGIDPVFWGDQTQDPASISFRTWVYGAWGATIAGWGISMLFLVYRALNNGERWAWYALCGGLLVWYLFDTGISAYYRVWFNVVFNTLIAVLFALPLAGIYPHLIAHQATSAE
jgi:hypothetical protein